MLVDPADKLLSVVDIGQLSVPQEEPSVVSGGDLEDVGDPLYSSSFVEDHPSSLTEVSLSQSLSATEELSTSVVVHNTDSPQPSHSAEQPPPFNCGCTRVLKGEPCSSIFSPQYYQQMRDNCAELLKKDLDNIVKGQIMAFTCMDDMTHSRDRHASKERQRARTAYYHQGHKICWRTFAYLHGIGKTHSLYTS